MGARLNTYWQNWQSIDADQWVISILQKGYYLPFDDESPPLTTSPPELSYRCTHNLFQELLTQTQKLLVKQAIEEVDISTPGFYSRLFLATKQSGGWRPVIDLSALNRYISPPHFKMESVNSIMKALQPQSWCTSLDLQDAFFHIPVAHRHRHFLRFVIQGRAYQFKALPFGLGTSPYVFTRVVKAVGSYARACGLPLIQYLDDWILYCASSSACSLWTTWLVELVKGLGLLINLPKSDLTPAQLIQYIGILFDLVAGTARPADHRIRAFLALAQRFLQHQPQPAQEWQRVLGHMTSLEKLVPRGRLHMRPVQLRLRDRWSQHTESQFKLISLDLEATQALQWWMDIHNLELAVPLRVPAPELILFTDASTKGWGAHLDHLQAEGLWTVDQQMWHINNLELLTVLLALQQFQSSVQGKSVQIMTDNTTVVGQIKHQGGTHSRELFNLTRQLFQWADEHAVLLVARHIPGHLNVIADRLSRRHQVIHTEWSLAPEVARKLWQLWGQPHVDLFATRENTKLPTFVSPLQDSQAWRTDALSFSWDNLWMYAYPPTPLLAEVLLRIAGSTCELILIAPAWATQTWFSLLLDLSSDHPRRLPLVRTLLRQPDSLVFHDNPALLNLHAWRLSGPLSKIGATQRRWLGESPLLTERVPSLSMIASGVSTAAGVRKLDTIHSIPLLLS